MVTTLRKLCARLAYAPIPSPMARSPGPFQTGVGVSNGTLIITRAIPHAWDDTNNVDHDIMCLDLSRAFNNVRRPLVRRQVMERFPQMAPLTPRRVVSIGHHPSIRLRHMENGNVVDMPSVEGVLRGCPLGSSPV